MNLTNHHSLADAELKKCGRCREHKPFSAFTTDKGGSHGRAGHCKQCVAARKRESYHEGPLKEYMQLYSQTARGRESNVAAVKRWTAKQTEPVTCQQCGQTVIKTGRIAVTARYHIRGHIYCSPACYQKSRRGA